MWFFFSRPVNMMVYTDWFLIFNQTWILVTVPQDGGVEGCVRIFSCENFKIATNCWIAIDRRMISAEKDTPHSRANEKPQQDGERKSESCSVISDSLQPHELYSPWNSPGQNTGVDSLSLFQGIFPTQGSNPGLMHCKQILYHRSHKGSPRILEWVAYPFSSRSSRARNQTRVSHIAGGFFANWAIREANGRRGKIVLRIKPFTHQTCLEGSKITADGDCSHEIKRHLLLGRRPMTNLDSELKSRVIPLPTKVCTVKAMVFPVVMYGCELDHKKSWVPKNWCFWTAVLEKTLESLKGDQTGQS